MEEQEQSQHDQAMIAKVDANEQKTQAGMLPDSEVTPALEEEPKTLYAGKYNSVEDMEKAYKELESKLGTTEETPTPVVEEEAPTEETAKEVAESKGVDYDDLAKEFATTGALSEETYQSLSDKGIPKAMVDAYIVGQQAVIDQTQGKLQALAGGEAGYQSMINWATTNLSESEQQAFNTSLSTENGADFAIQGLYARYKAEQGPNLIKGGAAPATSNGYQSKAEMTTDMHSPQYKKDPAFRAMVAGKIGRSKF